MANQVFKVERFVLQNEEGEAGKEVKVTPLPIKKLREFQKELAKLDKAKDDEDALDTLFNCAVIAITARNPDVTKEELEDSLDYQTLLKVLETAGGVNLDPNQVNPVKTE